jgi:hypothetical protein
MVPVAHRLHPSLMPATLSDALVRRILGRMVQAKSRLELVDVTDPGHVLLLDEPIARAAIGRFLRRMPLP